MKLNKIAILSPGEMGHAVGPCLLAGRFDVASCLAGRSQRTQALAAAAGIRNIPDLDELVRTSDLILAILVPDQAAMLAKEVAVAIRRTGSSPVYVDCNAVAPSTVLDIEQIITGAGGRFLDVGIIGGPPSDHEKTRFYVSGPHEEMFLRLDGHGILVRPLGSEIGRASGLKMCYASVTKGISALYAAALITAEVMDLSKDLMTEFSESQKQRMEAIEGLKNLSAKSFRWIGEMREIAATYAQAGVTPEFHAGAAEIFRLITESRIGHERPETVDQGRTLKETISIFAEQARSNMKEIS